MKSVTVRVTKEDIASGVRRSRSWCPIARGIKTALHVVGRVRVSGCGTWRIISLQHPADGYLSRRARQFMHAFDAGKPVKPFSFKLRIPEGK